MWLQYFVIALIPSLNFVNSSLFRYAGIKVKLHYLNLNYGKRHFFCHTPINTYNGLCNIKVFLHACNYYGTEFSTYRDFINKYKNEYDTRYTNISNGINNKVLDYFRNLINFECSDNTSFHNFDGINEKTFNSNDPDVPEINFSASYWAQKIIIWLYIWTKDPLSEVWPNQVWYAEFLENEDIIKEDGKQETVFRTKNTINYGQIDGRYGFYDLETQIGLNHSYKCTKKGIGPWCSTLCEPSVQNECDPNTANAICKPGWLGIPVETDKVYLPIYNNCSIEDTCYKKDCGDQNCVRTSSGSICYSVQPSISPTSICLEILETVQCVLNGTLPYNAPWTGSWKYETLDNSAIINGDKLSFDTHITLTEIYYCTIINTAVPPPQTYSKGFQFLVYEKDPQVTLNVEREGKVFLGQNIQCNVEFWESEYVNFTIYANNSNTLILEFIDSGIYQISSDSKVGKNGITCVATLTFPSICSNAPITRSISITVYVEIFPEFGWCEEERNVFYRGVDKDPFCCASNLASSIIRLNVTVMHEPKFSDNNELLNHIHIPGTYYIACQLVLLGSNISFTVYKYLHINYYPTYDELVIVQDTFFWDSKIKCLPLPFPPNDFKFIITFYNGTDNSSLLGSVKKHTVQRIPFDLGGHSSHLIKCTIKPKQGDKFKILEKYFIIHLKGWENPIVLQYINWRVWASVFYVSTIVMMVLVSLAWIIHLKSTGSISGHYLTKRTGVLTNLRRRNVKFYAKFLEWVDLVNAMFFKLGIIPLSVGEAYEMLKTSPNIAKDFFEFSCNPMDTAAAINPEEKKTIYEESISLVRNRNLF